MTRAEADLECAARNGAATDGPGVRFMVREEAPGEWSVVRVVIPGARSMGPMKTSTEARPRPEEAPDPRPLHNPLWGGPV